MRGVAWATIKATKHNKCLGARAQPERRGEGEEAPTQLTAGGRGRRRRRRRKRRRRRRRRRQLEGPSFMLGAGGGGGAYSQCKEGGRGL